MTAVLSCTHDDLYLFNLPFAMHSWHKLGVKCILFMPNRLTKEQAKKCLLVMDFIPKDTEVFPVDCEPDKSTTYAQCARLYGACVDKGNGVLITADADMCVFDKTYWQQFDYNGAINIIGADLVAEGQVPMCYIAMPAVGWDHVMDSKGRSYQECLDDLLGSIECDNFRGNYWAKDQETAFNHIMKHPEFPIVRHNRASPGTQFATRRADRDCWPDRIPGDIIDAHLPRPGYEDVNFWKILQLFTTMYPGDSNGWMYDYREAYLKLMEND